MNNNLRKPLIVILSAYALLIAAIVYSVRLAYADFEPIIDDHYYEKGLDYQGVLNRRKAAEKAGYRIIEFGFQPAGKNGSIVLVLTAPERDAAPVMHVRWERRATMKQSRNFRLQPEGKKCGADQCLLTYRSSDFHPDPGQWELTALADINEMQISGNRSVEIP